MRISDWSSYVCSSDLQVTATYRTIMQVQTTGGVILWKFQIRNDAARIQGYLRDGTLLVDQGVSLDINGEFLNKWARWRFQVQPDGGGARWDSTWIPIGGSGGTFGAPFAAGVGRSEEQTSALQPLLRI